MNTIDSTNQALSLISPNKMKDYMKKRGRERDGSGQDNGE